MRQRSLSTRRAARVVTAALAALFAAALWATVGTAPAAAGIYDGDAGPSYTFVITGNGNGSDLANDVLMASGVTYVAGESRYAGGNVDATLTRISHATWTATTAHYDSKYHLYDTAHAVARGPDGSIYTAGTSVNAEGNSDVLVVKWSKSGAVVWARRYNGPVKGQDGGADVAVDRAGNVVVCGYSDGSYGQDWVVVSWTGKGVRRWAWRYSGSGHDADVARELLLDKVGRTYVTGVVVVSGGRSAAGVAKLGTGGGKLWVRTYTGPATTGASSEALAADPAGGVYVAGWAQNGATGLDAMVARYSPAGARSVFPLQSMGADDGPDVFWDVAVTAPTGQVVAVGNRQAPTASSNPFYARFTAAGDLQERGQSPSAANDRWTSVAADRYGGWVMTGQLGSDGTDIYTGRKSTFTGGTTWWSRYSGPFPSQPNIGYAVAVRGGMTAAVGMQYSGATTGWDQVALIWVY